jgi:O-antigen/teichoic acid export membrane protein
MYPAMMCAIIGAIFGYVLDQAYEDALLGWAIGAQVGTILGIIYHQVNDKNRKPFCKRSKDYIKAFESKAKTDTKDAI